MQLEPAADQAGLQWATGLLGCTDAHQRRHLALPDQDRSRSVHQRQQIVESRGHVSPAEVAAFKAAGHTDADVLEVLVNVVLNIYTNYTNHIAGTEIDFPAAPAKIAA